MVWSSPKLVQSGRSVIFRPDRGNTSDCLGKVPKKDFFPVRKVPKWKTHMWQTMVRSLEQGRIPIYCTSRFPIERAEGPGTMCIHGAVPPHMRPLPLPCLAPQQG